MNSCIFVSKFLVESLNDPAILLEKALNAQHMKDSPPKAVFIVAPTGCKLDAETDYDVTMLEYDGEFEFQRCADLWRGLQSTPFSRVDIYGVEPKRDREIMLVAQHLDAEARWFHRARQPSIEFSAWRDQVVTDFTRTKPEIMCYSPREADYYFASVNKWAANAIASRGFLLNTAPRSRASNLHSFESSRILASDLLDRARNFNIGAHGVSWSHFRRIDGTLIYTPDFYKFVANQIGMFDGVSSVLDLGCGSGFATCHLQASKKYKRVLGTDGATQRVLSAKFHADLCKIPAKFECMDMAEIKVPDKSFDLTFTVAALEQAGSFLDRAIDEMARVTKKVAVLFEPTPEFFTTFPGYVNVHQRGWAQNYISALIRLGRPFSVRPNIISHYYNATAAMVINFEDTTDPLVKYPKFFTTMNDFAATFDYRDFPSAAIK